MKDFLKFLIVVGLLIFVFFGLIKPTVVKETSMATTLNNNDYLILSRVAYHNDKEPQRGDIIVFETSTDSEAKGYLLVKRVIGVEGDTVDIHDGNVYLNGNLLDEPYVSGNTYSEVTSFTVDEDTVFAMGDNREVSLDSRKLGCVSEENIVGKAVLRVYPFDNITLFD